jgi:predicted TIM-barrel fold metal-dependent hydrolase
MTDRIDVHHHLLPDFYRRALNSAGLREAGGRQLPDWSVGAALELMDLLGTRAAIVSISTPGVNFIEQPDRSAGLARDLNDFSGDLARERPERFGFFATLPMPDLAASVAEAERALGELRANGVVALANNRGVYIGAEGQDPLFRLLDERSAVVFIHAAELPGPAVDGIAPFAADFLLDTTRAAYLLVRNRIVSRYRNIRFILSHAGGFVPYASHRMAVAIAAETNRTPLEALEDFQSFYFDTALSSSPAALPTLLAFARTDRVLFGSDWPFAPRQAAQYFASGLDAHNLDHATRVAINHDNAARLFQGVAGEPPLPLPAVSRGQLVRQAVQRAVARAAFKLVQPR